MVWIALLIVIVLILRNISTSHVAASTSNLPSKIKLRVCGSGDGFCGNTPTTVAGVPEPTQTFPLQCNMIRVGTKTSGTPLPKLPVHISLPAIQPLPPPLAIQQQPVRSTLYGGGPITAPRPIGRTYTL